MTTRLISLLFLLATSSLISAQTASRSVAVLPFSNNAVDSIISREISDAITSELSHSTKVRILDRFQAQASLESKGFGTGGSCQASDCAIEAGRLLSVQDVLIGSVGKLGDSYSISARIVDAHTGLVIASALEATTSTLDTVVAILVPRIAARLVSRLPADTTPHAPFVKKNSAAQLPANPWLLRHQGFHPRVECLLGYPDPMEALVSIRAGFEWNGFGFSAGMGPAAPLVYALDDYVRTTLVIPALTGYWAWKAYQFELTYAALRYQSSPYKSAGGLARDHYTFQSFSANTRFDVLAPGGLSLLLGVGVLRYDESNSTLYIPGLHFGVAFSN